MRIRLTRSQKKIIKYLHDNEGSYILQGKLYDFQEFYYKHDTKFFFKRNTLDALVKKGLLAHYLKPGTWTLSMIGTQEAEKITRF